MSNIPYPNQELQDLKRRAGLDPYIRRLPDIQPAGANEWRARCPFHSDSRPSLSIAYKDGVYVWHCFPCGKGGDVLAFVQAKDGISFADAKKVIETECGLGDSEATQPKGEKNDPEVPETCGKACPPFQFDREEAKALLKKSATALAYLESRGIKPEIALEAGVGYVPDHPVLGEALALPYGSEPDSPVKFRAINPPDKSRKFRHLSNIPSKDRLYGIEELSDDLAFFADGDVYVTESELDALTLRSHGLPAVSVSSATTCLRDGKLAIKAEHLEKLDRAERIFIVTDMDSAGVKCAEAFAACFPSYKLFRIEWPYTKPSADEASEDPKDVGELYTKFGPAFKERLIALRDEAPHRPPAWRKLFKSYSELAKGEVEFLIDKFLPQGVTFIGGTPGSGKTWFALSMAKALVSGKKFLGLYNVPKPAHVLYLIPEAGEKSFRVRLEKLGIVNNDRFLCRTVNQGSLRLDDPLLLAAVAALRPVIFLDSTIRFISGTDENAAGQISKNLSDVILELLAAGAQAVVAIHHAPKRSAKQDVLTLESALRGTGDFGALADAAYALKCLDASKLITKVFCVKARDFEPLEPFEIQGRPFIDQKGHLVVLSDEWEQQAEDEEQTKALLFIIQQNPSISYRELERETGIDKSRIARLLAREGWSKQRHSPWVSTKSHTENNTDTSIPRAS